MINEQSSKALGWSQQELIVQNIASMINMLKEHASHQNNYFLQSLKTGINHMIGTGTEQETEACCKDGCIVPCILGLNLGSKLFYLQSHN